MGLDVDGDGRVTVKELLGLRAHHVHKAVRFAVVGAMYIEEDGNKDRSVT